MVTLALLLASCLPAAAQQPKAPPFERAPTKSQAAYEAYVKALDTWDPQTQAGELPEAEALLRQALETDGDFWWAHVALSQVLRVDGRPVEAEEHAARAAELAPQSLAALAELAAGRLEQGDLEGCLAACQAGLALGEPKAAEPYPYTGAAELHRLLAETARARSDTTAARDEADQALATDPKWPWSYATAALVSRDMRDVVATKATLERATQRFPAWPVAYHHLGDLARAAGDTTAAKDGYRKALEVAPTFADAAVALADLLRNEGQTTEAARLLSVVVRVRPHWPDRHKTLANLLWDQTDYEGSLVERQALCDLDPADAMSFHALASTLSALARNEEAAQAEDHAVELDPTSGFLRWAAANYYSYVGKTDEALARYEAALALPEQKDIPHTTYVRRSLAWLYYSRKEDDKALQLLLEGTQATPNRNAAWCCLGTHYERAEQWPEAARAFRHAAELAPRSIEALTGLLKAFDKIGPDRATAMAAFDQAVAEVRGLGDMPPALPDKAKGYFLRDMGDPAAAAEAYERALELQPDDLWARASVGHAYCEAGLPEAAVPHYEALVADGDERRQAEGHFMLACIHAQAGDADRAIEELRAALTTPMGGRCTWLLRYARFALEPEPLQQAHSWSFSQGDSGEAGNGATLDFDLGPALANYGLVPLRDDPRFLELVGETP